MAGVNLDKLHDKVDAIGESVARIEGRLDGMREEKKSGFTFFGLLTALILGVWNLIR